MSTLNIKGWQAHEQLGELYIETLCQNAYYEGAAGTIRDAVLLALSGDNKTNANIGCIDAAAKLTRDAMGFVERCLGWVSDDWFKGGADWKRIDAYWDSADSSDAGRRWLIEQLQEQSERAWRAYFDHAGRPGVSDLGVRWHHDMALAATFLEAAAMLLQEVEA
jgi:hypothetical protein